MLPFLEQRSAPASLWAQGSTSETWNSWVRSGVTVLPKMPNNLLSSLWQAQQESGLDLSCQLLPVQAVPLARLGQLETSWSSQERVEHTGSLWKSQGRTLTRAVHHTSPPTPNADSPTSSSHPKQWREEGASLYMGRWLGLPPPLLEPTACGQPWLLCLDLRSY